MQALTRQLKLAVIPGNTRRPLASPHTRRPLRRDNDDHQARHQRTRAPGRGHRKQPLRILRNELGEDRPHDPSVA